MPSPNKTETLELHRWQENEYVDFVEIGEDNQKIDDAIKDLKENSFNSTAAESIIQEKINALDLDTKFQEKVSKTDVVNDLTSGGVEKVLSAEQGKILNNQLMDFDLLSNSSGIKKQTTFASNGSILEVLRKTSGNVKVADRETSFLSDGRIREVVKFYNPAGATAIKTITKTTTFASDGSIAVE